MKIQFIAYCVHVGSKGGSTQETYMKHAYPGHPDPVEDVKRRCALLAKVVDIAHKDIRTSPSSDVLKVFVAPEFFFRGQQGAYSMEQYQATLSLLQTLANAGKFANWLFLFGSIVATAKDEDDKDTIYNIVVMQRGNQGEGGCKVVMKEKVSDMDFPKHMAKVGAIGMGSTIAPKSGGTGTGKEKQTRRDSGEGIFEYDGVTYGVEICVDHLDHRLRKSAVARGEARVQVQIVPSAGVAGIVPKSVVAIQSGLVFNCDGSSGGGGFHGGEPNFHSKLCTVTKAASGTTDATLKDVQNIGHKRLNPTLITDNLFWKGPGQIHWYPPLQVPAASSRSKAQFWADYSV